MSTIQPNMPGGLDQNTFSDQDQTVGSNTGQADDVLNRAVLQNPELIQSLTELANSFLTNKTTSSTNNSDSLVNKAGAPAISAPTQEFSASDMVDLLRAIRSKSTDVQLAGAAQNAETARIKSEKNADAQVQKIKEWVDKWREAQKSDSIGNIFGWIGKVVAVLAAVAAVAIAAVATVATGGAAAPLLVFASIALVGATMSLASQISQQFGGPEISLSNLVSTATSKMLEAFGVDKETAEKVGKVMVGVVGLAGGALVEPSMLGTAATGIAELCGADEQTAGYIGMAVGMVATIAVGILMVVVSGGSSAISSTARIASSVISAGAQVAQGVTAVAQGATKINSAVIRRDADDILAQKEELKAAMVKFQKDMEENREEMKKLIDQIEQSVQIVSKMISGSADSLSQIIKSMGRKSAV